MKGLALRIGNLLAAVVELSVCQRGLAVLFLGVAGVLATAGWLRPPLSADLRSYHLPLGVWPDADCNPEQILHGPRWLSPDSAGAVVLTLILIGTALVAWRPQQLGAVAGLLLCGAMIGNAAVAVNHPVLIEMMDQEYEQRRQIASMSAESPEGNPMSPEESPMAAPDNGRIGLPGAPVADEQRGDLMRGWVYLLYGYWLIPWAGFGILLGGRGLLQRRMGHLALWILVGTGLAGLACGRRLAAEYHWHQANTLEARCDYDAACRALQAAVAGFPEFERLERTWLLAGKLDFRQKRATPQERFFRAYQLSRNRTRPRGIAFQQDLPWLITRSQDYREGLATAPSGYYLTMAPGGAETGTPDTRKGYHFEDRMLHDSPVFEAYWFANFWEPRRALHLMDELLAEEVGRHPAVRNQAARLWTNAGLNSYLRSAILTDAGLVYSEQNRWLTASQEAWRKAVAVDPKRRDGQLYLGMVQARADRARPELVDAQFAPFLQESADLALRADILNVLGDAYFEAGQMTAARRRFVESFDVYNMPRVGKINYRAQRRLGGL